MNQFQLPNIEVRRIKRLRGPNVWSNRAVLEAWVDLGAFEQYPSNLIEGFTERLTTWLPSLVEHRCSVGERGGFLSRLRDGTWMGHVLEHVTLELQTLAHSPVGYGRARETGEYAVYRVVIECLEPSFGERALTEGLRLIHAAARGEEFDIQACIARLREEARRRCLEPNTAELVAAATRLGLPVVRLSSGNLVQFGYGASSRRAWSAQTDRTAAVAGAISQNPELRDRLLRGVGLPTTAPREVGTVEEAWAVAGELGSLITIRPAGKRRTPDLSPIPVAAGKADVEAAYQSSVTEGSGVIVEKWVPGALFRLLVVGDNTVAVRRLGASGYSEPTAVSGLHPEVAAACVLAARTIGLDVAGVDVVAEDLHSPLSQSGAVVVDVTPNPDLMTYGDDRDVRPSVGDAVIRHLFDGAPDPQFLVFAVSGGGARRAGIAAGLARALDACRGFRTALVGETGIAISGEPVYSEDARDFESGLRVLTHPSLEAAVFEVSAEQVLEQGLPFSYCNVAVVLSTSEEGAVTGPWETPPYLTPEFVRKAVRAPADVVPANGWLVLDATIDGAASMAERCPGRVLYWSTDGNNEVLRKHIAAGERAVTVVDGQVTYFIGPDRCDVGRFANQDDSALGILLPCVAALLVSAVPIDVLRRELFETPLTPYFNPGPGRGPDAAV